MEKEEIFFQEEHKIETLENWIAQLEQNLNSNKEKDE